MRWRRRERSGNLRDERAGGGGGFPVGVGKASLPVLLIGLVLFLVTRGLGGGGGGLGIPGLDQFPQAPAQGQPVPEAVDPDADLVDFVSFVLDDVQATWERQFSESGDAYAPAQLVLFTGGTQTGCGGASSAVGPFYCPGDQTVYLDLDFFRELRRRFGAPGDFAQAYVIAHELGHHVQKLLGISDQVQRLTDEDPDQANELSIDLELQADCLAGVWGYTAKQRGMLEPGDLHEGLRAAAAVGDDRIQEETTGQVNKETWTHGSSEQRQHWFSRGFESGIAESCDTFAGS